MAMYKNKNKNSFLNKLFFFSFLRLYENGQRTYDFKFWAGLGKKKFMNLKFKAF
jgi:hypothetical protein